MGRQVQAWQAFTQMARTYVAHRKILVTHPGRAKRTSLIHFAQTVRATLLAQPGLEGRPLLVGHAGHPDKT